MAEGADSSECRAAAREWCEASNEYARAVEEYDARVAAEHAAHALLPEIRHDERGDALPDASKDHGPHNPIWVAWAATRDALSRASGRLKAAVSRYNARHAALYRLGGVVPANEEPLDQPEEPTARPDAHPRFQQFVAYSRLPPEQETPFDPCAEMPCPSCDGKLSHTGHNKADDLAFIECGGCGLAFVVAAKKHQTQRSVE